MNLAQLQTWQVALGIISTLVTLGGVVTAAVVVVTRMQDHSARHTAEIANLGGRFERLQTDIGIRNESLVRVETQLRDHMDQDERRFEHVTSELRETNIAIEKLGSRMQQTVSSLEGRIAQALGGNR